MTIRILLFAALSSLSVGSMFIGDDVELRIASEYVSNWMLVEGAYRALILSTLYLAFSIILGGKNHFIRGFLLLCTFIVSFDTLLFFSNEQDTQALFIHPLFPISSYLMVLLLVITSFLFSVKMKKKQVSKWILLGSIVPAIILSFIKTVYRDDWMSANSTSHKIISHEVNTLMKSSSENHKKILTPFLSTSCGSCRLSAKKMGISMRNGTLPNTHAFFYETPEKVQTFIKETNFGQISYTILQADTFLRYAGFRLPSIFYVDGDSSVQWVGEQFNNMSLDYLASKVVN